MTKKMMMTEKQMKDSMKKPMPMADAGKPRSASMSAPYQKGNRAPKHLLKGR